MGAGQSPGMKLFSSIAAARPALVTGVPDGMLAEAISLCQASVELTYIACAREEECIGLASGAAMAGERAVVMMQIVTNRGALADPNGYDIEKRDAFDAGVRPVARVFDFDAGALPDDLVPAAFRWAEAARKPVILALEKRLGSDTGAAA